MKRFYGTDSTTDLETLAEVTLEEDGSQTLNVVHVDKPPVISTFCGLCGEVVHARKHVEHAGSRWHLFCWQAFIEPVEPNPHGGDGGR
jgi:hypothetical protein